MFLDCLTLVNDRLSSVRARLLKVGDLATNQTVAGVSRRCFVEDAILAAAGEEGSSFESGMRTTAARLIMNSDEWPGMCFFSGAGGPRISSATRAIFLAFSGIVTSISILIPEAT